MKFLIISCLISVLAFVGASNHTDGRIELEPTEEPYPGLRRGPLSEIIPKRKPKAGGFQMRIVRGDFANPEQLPYQVALVIGFGTNAYAFCGGTILGNEWIVTAAHCIRGAKSIEVRLGGIYRDSPLRVSWGYQVVVISTNDDIALVKMQWVDFNPNIAPAALPPRNGRYSDYVDTKAVASGWGGIDDHGHGSDRLRFAEMKVISTDSCERNFGQFSSPNSILCTRSDNMGAVCSGDSGGPLVIKGTRTLIGIIAFGAANACTKGYPSGYTRITPFLDFINIATGISW